MTALPQKVVHSSLGDRVLLPTQFPCQLSRQLVSFQHRPRNHDFGHSIHRRLPLSALAVLQRLSRTVEGHPEFEGTDLHLQLLGDLPLGHVAVNHADSVTTGR